MTREFDLEYRIRFEAERCFVCSKWWAREQGTGRGATCPYCKSAYYTGLDRRVTELKNQVTALKGQVTRLKREKQGP